MIHNNSHVFQNFSNVNNHTDISADDLFDHCMLANHSVTVRTKDVPKYKLYLKILSNIKYFCSYQWCSTSLTSWIHNGIRQQPQMHPTRAIPATSSHVVRPLTVLVTVTTLELQFWHMTDCGILPNNRGAV